MLLWSKLRLVISRPCLERVGLISVTLITFQTAFVVVNLFYTNVVRPIIRSPRLKLKGMGQWAVVTGAADGLGKAFAFALAKEGINIILICRSEKKALAVAAEIEAEYRVRTMILEADLESSNDNTYKQLERSLRGREVGILVNNMSCTYPHPEYFLDLPYQERIYAAIIQCNIVAVTRLTRILLPGMVKRGKGVVINVSSTAALIPCPLLTVYAASKAYVEKFSRDLDAEYRRRGIIIQCLTPGYIATTARGSVTKESWMVPSPERYVQGALSCLGEDLVTTAYYPHTLLVGIIKLLRSVSPTFAARAVLQGMEVIRCRALQRYLI